MTIIIDDTEYELNVEKAIQVQVLKKVVPKITDISTGDVFSKPGSGDCILITSSYDNRQFFMSGLRGLKCYANFSGGVDKSKMIYYLNERGHVFVKNINNEVADILAKLCEE